METQEPSLDTALNNYREAEPILLDPERIVTLNGRKLSMQELLAAWDQGLSEEHLGNPGLSTLWAQFSALRSKLAGSVRLLLYNPLEWLAGRPEVAAEVTRFLDLASALYQGVQNHFRVMAGISEGYARSVLEGLLALDILQVRVRLAAGAFAHKAVMLPTHPLHLWRHQRLTQILRGLGDKLDPEDRKAIIEDTQRPEHFLSVIGLGSIPDGKGAAQVLPVSGEIQGMATFENLINAYGGADGKETLSYAIDRYASLARHHARPLRMGVINPPEPNRLLAECVRLLNSPRFRQPATLPRLRVEFFATPTHTGRIKSALRFGDEVRDLVEEKLASGRLELALHEDTLELAERVKQLAQNPFHILAVFDEASIRMRRRGAGKGLPMSPFCIRHKIQVERFENIIRLIPDSNEPPFSEFMQLVNEAESGQRDSTPHAWADAEGLRRTVDELLQGASPAAQWVLLADRALPTETGMASVRLLQRRNGQRQVLLATRDYCRIAQLLRPAFDRFNVVLSPQQMEGLLYEGVNLIGAGLLDLIQSKDGRADPKRVLGLAGLLFAARDYQRRHPQGLIVSVDNEMARLWLRMGGGKGRERSDLLGLDRTGDGFVIDCIEVKTTASDNLSDTDARMEHAVAQVRATLDALAEALPRDESGSGPLSAPRSEMLKEVLVRACQARNISPERRRQWGQWLKQLFRQEADEDPVEIGLRGEVIKVLLGDNRRATESEWEAEPYPITVRSLGEGEVQDLIAWRPDPLSSEPCSRPVTPGAHAAPELPAQPIPAGAMAPQLSAPAVLASPAAPMVTVPDPRPQPGTPSDAPWPPPVNTLGMIGQTRAVQQLVDQARFARSLGERFADKLLVGPAGVGKSSLARAIARLLLDEPEILFNGSDLRRPELLIDRLRQEGRIADDGSQPMAIARCLVFIDEVHAIGAATATTLLSVMDDQRLTTMEGVTYSFGNVVFILATTDPGRLSEAFNSRPDKTWLRPYTLDELAGIIWLHGRECLDGFELAREVCLEIAARMRANPRRAVRSLREALRPYFFRMRSGTGTGSPGLADIGRAMTLDAVGVYYDEQGIDSNGLDNTARSFLQYLLRNGATAEPRLKQGLGITNPGDFIEVDEYLHRLGLIEITAGGRALTRLGRRYLDQPLPLRERISRQLD